MVKLGFESGPSALGSFVFFFHFMPGVSVPENSKEHKEQIKKIAEVEGSSLEQ